MVIHLKFHPPSSPFLLSYYFALSSSNRYEHVLNNDRSKIINYKSIFN